MKEGGVFVVDEINACPPEVLFFMHSVLDDERMIVLKNKDGSRLNAHPGFWFVATMNPDYEGTEPLNKALKDRFPVKLNYDYDTKIEEKLLRGDYKNLRELAKKLRVARAKGELITPTSTRLLLNYTENVKIFGNEIAKEIFINNFEYGERKVVREVFEMVMEV
jgi:MoxR-like ATPase